MAVSMIKFVVIFFITIATLGGVNGQITAIAPGFQQTISLLANVTDTATVMCSILLHLESSLQNQEDLQILANLLHENNTGAIEYMAAMMPDIIMLLQDRWEKEGAYTNETTGLLLSQLEVVQDNHEESKTILQNHQYTLTQMADIQSETLTNVTNMTATQRQTLDTLADIRQTERQMLAAQTVTQNTLTNMNQTQTQTLKTLNAMANTFNQVASLLEIQSRQLHNMTVAMNTMVSVLENQQDILQNISRSSPGALDPRIHQTYPPNQSIESGSTNAATSEKPTTTGMTTGTDGTATETARVTTRTARITTGTARMTTGTAGMTPGTDRMTTETPGMTTERAGITTDRVEMPTTELPEMTTNVLTTVVTAPPIQNCLDLVFLGDYPSGIYSITPNQGSSYNVYCEMETEFGGWTVFQKRFDGSVDFYRGWLAWNDYKEGFGSLDGEFWLGLERLHLLTSSSGKSWELMIKLEDFNNDTAYEIYQPFSIGNEASNYTLYVGSYYIGNAGNSLSSNNRRHFTTYNRDNDNWSSSNCARSRQGAWWYGRTYYYHDDCSYSNLNGRYLGPTGNDLTGMYWYDWKRSYRSLKASTMMMRPLTE
ncbi:uncharacterized protein [Amphiura filiformis]|uniref:uncharacterized protein n=1 Tax=Amphiura filiformis TaxID=82378 RepID=UPI003B21932D